MSMIWNVYLSGEIHTDWRERIEQGAEAAEVPVEFSAPVTNHAASDDAGDVLGAEAEAFWKDHKSSKVNGIRTKTLISNADLVVVRFGDQYKQWNAAFDAGFAAALSKPIIVIHSNEHQHALKEIDAAALATVQRPGQIVQILQYVINGKL